MSAREFVAWINLASCYREDDKLSCSVLDNRVMGGLQRMSFRGPFVFCSISDSSALHELRAV